MGPECSNKSDTVQWWNLVSLRLIFTAGMIFWNVLWIIMWAEIPVSYRLQRILSEDWVIPDPGWKKKKKVIKQKNKSNCQNSCVGSCLFAFWSWVLGLGKGHGERMQFLNWSKAERTPCCRPFHCPSIKYDKSLLSGILLFTYYALIVGILIFHLTPLKYFSRSGAVLSGPLLIFICYTSHAKQD